MKTKIQSNDYSAKAFRYCEQVVSGEIIACKWIKLACQRHLDDLQKQDNKDYPFRFDKKKANKICKFAELLPHVKGKWARKRQRLHLEDWQCFILCSIFGWLRKKDNLRRFRTAAIYVPRKNGKSFLSSTVGLYMLCMDGETSPEILCGATTIEQAAFVFRACQQIVKKTPELKSFGIEVPANALKTKDGGVLQAIIGQPPDGSSPSCALIDELHEFVNDILLTTMQTGMGSREQPLTFITTTTGYNLSSPAKLLQDDIQDMLLGLKLNDELFGVLYTIDEGDNPFSELALRKSNPNLDVSVFLDYLKQQQLEAVQSARKQTAFKTKHLNIWCNAAINWMNLEKWDRCGEELNIEDFKDEPFWIGLDLASKIDLTAYVKIFKRLIDGKAHYYLFSSFYLPEDRANESTNSHYKQWEIQGYLKATPGSVNVHTGMFEDICEDAKQNDLQEIAHDPYGARELVARLQEQHFTCVEIQQTWQQLSEPMKELEAIVLDKRLHHDKNPVLRFSIANTSVKQVGRDQITPYKTSEEKKIDGTVASIMALNRASLFNIKPQTMAFVPFTVYL